MIQEHERAVGGWQAEWPTVAATIQSVGLADLSMADAAGGLEVNKARMSDNIALNRGTVFAERAMIILGKSIGRDVAHTLLKDAIVASRKGEPKPTPFRSIASY
jgi:3-carboxy-cis,cis-muconate cycloisomerase